MVERMVEHMHYIYGVFDFLASWTLVVCENYITSNVNVTPN